VPGSGRGDRADVTLGAFPTVDLAPIQQAFYDSYASQCGFCSPGMMMAATALLAHTPDASREQIMEALEGHLCRCTGYVKILDAVESVAKAGSA
jgi:carbon-monoxide dehydrogenase small subunit